MSYRVDYKKLRAGDVFWESSSYGNIHCRVISDPDVDQIEISGKQYDRYRWQAEIIDSGKVIDYTITSGMEHYGPSLYTMPMYMGTKR